MNKWIKSHVVTNFISCETHLCGKEWMAGYKAVALYCAYHKTKNIWEKSHSW